MVGKADIEFYESHLVMTIAKSSVLPNRTWEDLSYRSKQTYLNRAVRILQTLLNDEDCRERLAHLFGTPGRAIDPRKAYDAFTGKHGG